MSLEASNKTIAIQIYQEMKEKRIAWIVVWQAYIGCCTLALTDRTSGSANCSNVEQIKNMQHFKVLF